MAASPLLIVFGAGDARSSKRYTQAAERIVAVEPRAEAAIALQDALGDRGLVVTAAAGDGQGEAVLTHYELPEYTSEHRPAGLEVLFPGIKGVGSLTVDRVDAGELLADAFDVQTRTAAVIVDVNGAERAVLVSLSRAAAFHRVNRLEIRCGIDALYEGAMTAADAEDWLVGSGFCDVKVRGAGPLRTVSGERDLEALAAAALSSAQQEAEAMRRERDTARLELDRANETIAALQAEHAEALNAAWADLDAAKTETVEAKARLEAQSAQLEASNEAKAQAEEAAIRLQHDAEGARMELGSLRSNFETVRQQAVAAETERAQLASDRDALHRELQNCRDELARVREEVAAEAQTVRSEAAQRQDDLVRRSEEELSEVREALHAARSDLSLALHNKALTEDDLRDLRNRYAQLTEAKDRQDRLLQRLSQRLGEASRVLASAPEASVFEALTGKGDPARSEAPHVSRTASTPSPGKAVDAKTPAAKPRSPRKKKTGKAAK